MENQHRKISGYRELSQAEIDLMNRIKAFGPQLETLIADIDAHLEEQVDAAHGLEEAERLASAAPRRWVAIGKTHLQTGLMALTRAIDQPTFF